MLAGVYSYRVMVKSVSSCCVRGRWVLSNPVTNGDLFYNIVQGTLLPHLMPYDGLNLHSIIVMDNASIHHCQGISDMINGVGALLMYFPPYSPN